ncbi:MAG: hypothetical protein A2W03_16975 [Candidatus Aminicenantes bacterium RBG_16_63_16]|nr:MAG: hypothetical protein A2W03_16975 [Candidatus Aminicenantes bacterium RBG_16_63_16]
MKHTPFQKALSLTAALAVLFILMAGTAGAAGKFQEKFEKTVPLPKDGKVDISNISGQIIVTSWSQGEVRIEAVKYSDASSEAKAKENAAKVTIEVTTEGNVVRIETKYPRGGGIFGGESVDVTVEYKLTIPQEAGLKAKNISGEIVAEGVGGHADLDAVSGDIMLRTAAKGAECNSVSGDVTVTGVTGDVFVKSVSGDVRARQIKGSIEAESVSGELELTEVSEAGAVRAKALSGGIVYRGSINKAGTYTLKSHSGEVEMFLPAASAFDFEASTFSGDIESDFEISTEDFRASAKELRGVVNGGGAAVKLSSFSGDIRLKKT